MVVAYRRNWSGGARYLVLPFFYFICCIFALPLRGLIRPLQPQELEDCLQLWDAGLKLNMWLHVSIVASKCPGLGPGPFKGYLFKTPGRSAAERGFDWITYREKLTHVFILDRAAGANDVDDVVDPSFWKDFEALYIQSYEARREDFILDMLEVCQDPLYRSSTFTYASTVFGLDTAPQRTMASRLLGVM